MEQWLQRVQNMLVELNIDSLILTDYFNKRYFSGFTGTTGQGLILRDKKYFY